MTDRVFIRHSDHPERNGHVTRTAFDNLWSRKGYVVEGDESPPPPAGGLRRTGSEDPVAVEMATGDPVVVPAADGEDDADGSSAPTVEGLNAALDEKAQLRSELEAAGVELDRRWGLKRLRTEAATIRDATDA